MGIRRRRVKRAVEMTRSFSTSHVTGEPGTGFFQPVRLSIRSQSPRLKVSPRRTPVHRSTDFPVRVQPTKERRFPTSTPGASKAPLLLFANAPPLTTADTQPTNDVNGQKKVEQVLHPVRPTDLAAMRQDCPSLSHGSQSTPGKSDHPHFKRAAL